METCVIFTSWILAIVANGLILRFSRMALLENQLEFLLNSDRISQGACYGAISRFHSYRRHTCSSCKKPHALFDSLSLVCLFSPCASRPFLWHLAGEILFVSITGIFLLKLGVSAWFFCFLVLWFLFYMIAIIDFRYYIIPDELNYAGIAFGFFLALLGEASLRMDSQTIWPWMIGLGEIWNLPAFILGVVFSAGVLFVTAWLCSQWLGRDAMGGGDIKLIAMIGAVLGAKGALYTLALSSIAGSIFGLLFLVKARLIDRQRGFTMIAYGPYLILAALIVMYMGTEDITRLYHHYSLRFADLMLRGMGSDMIVR